MDTHNYEKFAKTYSQLDIKDTFYLGYRDIPKITKEYTKGKKAIDFGCGSGRSTRFLRKIGLETIGVDKSKDQINEAKKIDSQGEYHLIKNKIPFEDSTFDLAFLYCVLMEISSKDDMKKIFSELNRVLTTDGIVIIVTDAENMFGHDCASFIYNYPENKNIKSGMKVKLGFRGTDMVFYDYYWREKDYKEVFFESGFELLELHKPLATGKEKFKWFSEAEYPHFAVYVLKKAPLPFQK